MRNIYLKLNWSACYSATFFRLPLWAIFCFTTWLDGVY